LIHFYKRFLDGGSYRDLSSEWNACK